VYLMNKRFIVVAGAAVLTFALLAGGSFAWFSARAVATTSGAPSLADGVQGGMVAGHVDLKVAFESYVAKKTGTSYDKVLDGTSAAAAGIIYPGGEFYDENGALISSDNIRSIFKYTVENTSGTQVIARVNNKGLDINGVITTTTGTGSVDPIEKVNVGLYRLTGAGLADNKYGSDGKPVAGENSFFYFAKSPKGNPMKFLDTDFLMAQAFDGEQYNVNATATNGWKFYEYKSQELTAGGDGPIKFNSLIVDPNGTPIASRVASVDGYLYAEMPVGAKFTVQYELALSDDAVFGTPGTGANNEFQYAVYALDLDDSVAVGETGQLVAYGVQNTKTAVDDFYGNTAVWTAFNSPVTP
jgi:hypothetical protein